MEDKAKQLPVHSTVEQYYDTYVGGLNGRYVDRRWHSNLTGEFDYRQTLRALERALGVTKYESAVEIGPGDGVWTGLLRAHVSGRNYLSEQSKEMLAQAMARHSGDSKISFEHGDFLKSNLPHNNDLIMAIRCLEYFADKAAALEKMYKLLKPGGTLIIITKNAQFVTSVNVQNRMIHGGQQSRWEMQKLFTNAGFQIEATYPATLRWKIKYWISRAIFDALSRMAVSSRGRIWIPFIFTYAAESYCYVAKRPII